MIARIISEFCLDDMELSEQSASARDHQTGHLSDSSDDEDAMQRARTVLEPNDLRGSRNMSGQSSAATPARSYSFALCPPVPGSPMPAMPGAHARGASRHPSKGIQMGTSAPVAIPFAFMRGTTGDDLEDSDSEDDATHGPPKPHRYSDTFIPPHQLSQRTADMFYHNGQSPASAVDHRERLRARDAILKSTGFHESNEGSFVARDSMQPRSLAYLNRSGALSQALLHSGGP